MKLFPVLLIAGSALTTLSATTAAADESNWEARVRAVYLLPGVAGDYVIERAFVETYDVAPA